MDIFGTLPASVLTNKRSAPGAATPELASLKTARLVVAQEPERNMQLNASLIKELSGSDDIKCRDLYVGLSSYRPQYKVDLCCNKMPNVDADDGGIIRRLRVIEWKSKFSYQTREPDLENCLFPARELCEIQSDFEKWRDDMMRMLLILYVPSYRETPPEAVTKFTNSYLQENNFFESFRELLISPGAASDFFTVDQARAVWPIFQQHMRSLGERIPNVKKNEMKSGLQDVLKTQCLAQMNVKGQTKNAYGVFRYFKLSDEIHID